jgi:ligand-binding SRPBCC domain-containing protein
MKIYRYYEEQQLPVKISEAWDFFSNPRNLAVITPPEMNFVITNNPAEDIYTGMIITYKVRPLLNFPLNWVTEIIASERQHYFIDEQRFGPYKFWHHRHYFQEIPGGVQMKDEVYYSLPLGILGRLIHFMFIKRRVEEIFNYRRSILKKMFIPKQT